MFFIRNFAISTISSRNLTSKDITMQRTFKPRRRGPPIQTFIDFIFTFLLPISNLSYKFRQPLQSVKHFNNFFIIQNQICPKMHPLIYSPRLLTIILKVSKYSFIQLNYFRPQPLIMTIIKIIFLLLLKRILLH